MHRDTLIVAISIEERIPVSHLLRQIRKRLDQALDRRDPTLCQLHNSDGGPRCQRSRCSWLFSSRRSTGAARNGCSWRSSTTSFCTDGASLTDEHIFMTAMRPPSVRALQRLRQIQPREPGLFQLSTNAAAMPAGHGRR